MLLFPSWYAAGCGIIGHCPKMLMASTEKAKKINADFIAAKLQKVGGTALLAIGVGRILN
jgi:hypothetical protein